MPIQIRGTDACDVIANTDRPRKGLVQGRVTLLGVRSTSKQAVEDVVVPLSFSLVDDTRFL